jgi:hypothetical protein
MIDLLYSVYYNDVPVGIVCCRFEIQDGKAKLYIMTMGVLAVRDRILHALPQ